MTIDSQFLLVLSALGALNGVLISIYFWILQPFNISNRFLAVLILMISIRITKSVLFYFNPEITKVILQIGLSACFFIGPFLYFYCVSITGDIKERVVKWKLHIGLLFLFAFSINFIYPYQYNVELWGSVFYKLINYVWLFYIVLSGASITPLFKRLFERKRVIQFDDIWVLSVYLGNVIIWLAYFTASYTSYIVGALSFSFVFYLMCLLVVFKARANKAAKPAKYANKSIECTQADDLVNKLEKLMIEKQLYRNANLTMPEVAKYLAVSTPLLSQLLNDNLKKSFSLFINEYRITAAKKLLTGEKTIKMEVISEKCGFNSQSTFYNAFKKITGSTPAKYR